MRITGEANGVFLKAYAGTTGVLLAMNMSEARCKGLLGFAIHRSGGNRPAEWLTGLISFPGVEHQPGAPVSTEVAPIQRFRWSDYRVYPDTAYTYTVHPVYGTPAKPRVDEGPTVDVRTASARSGEHRILFNRAAAASQAFSREFPNTDAELKKAKDAGLTPELSQEALAWLSRGLLEQITGFIARAADPSWALDIAIYEYELPAIVDAVKAALARGADVRIVYHAKPADPQTGANEESLAGWPSDRMRARKTSSIFHDKFAVLSRVEGNGRRPVSVLCGSTNWTRSGIYLQANVVHIVERPEVAAEYASVFKVLFDDHATVGETRKWINTNDPLPEDVPLLAGFSPRSGEKDLDFFIDAINEAHQDLLFCTAFDLDPRIDAAVLGKSNDEVLRFGLENKPTEITGFHRDRTANFVATAVNKEGLDGFLAEKARSQSGILIHTKMVVVNFTSAAPIVISGSHNLSHNASADNDENFLVIRGDTDVADCYGVELMRLYEHYRFRWTLSDVKPADRPDDPCGPRPPGTLCPSDRWTINYFKPGSLEMADRERFSAPDVKAP